MEKSMREVYDLYRDAREFVDKFPSAFQNSRRRCRNEEVDDEYPEHPEPSFADTFELMNSLFRTLLYSRSSGCPDRIG